jgi:hypothetical protein
MGTPIPLGKEFFIKLYLRNGLRISRIARLEHVSRMTVRAIKRGRKVRRKSMEPPERPGPVAVPPYICERCSEAAGRKIRVCLRPCVACEARNLRENL